MSVTEKIDKILDEARMTPAQIEYIANSLTEKEWYVLGIMIGYKPNARLQELKYWSGQYNIPVSVDEYKTIVDSLFSKKAIQKNRTAPHTRDVWEFKFGNKLPSQVHHWAKDLKF